MMLHRCFFGSLDGQWIACEADRFRVPVAETVPVAPWGMPVQPFRFEEYLRVNAELTLPHYRGIVPVYVLYGVNRAMAERTVMDWMQADRWSPPRRAA